MKGKANIICMHHNDFIMNLTDILFCITVFISIYVLAISCCPKAFSIDSLEYHIGMIKIVYPSTWKALAGGVDATWNAAQDWNVEFSPINNLGAPTHAFFKVAKGDFVDTVNNDRNNVIQNHPAYWQNFNYKVLKNEKGAYILYYTFTISGQQKVAFKVYRGYYPDGSILISLFITSPSGYYKFMSDFIRIDDVEQVPTCGMKYGFWGFPTCPKSFNGWCYAYMC